MAIMPGNISKGKELIKFESFVNESLVNLNNALTFYRNNTDARAVLSYTPPSGTGGKPILDSAEQDHVWQHWFDDVPGRSDLYWEHVGPMCKVIRQGLIQALTLASTRILPADSASGLPERAIPVDCYWICAGSHFEVAVTLGHRIEAAKSVATHVNMLILTPSPPFSRRVGATGTNEEIWVVRHSPVTDGMLNTDPAEPEKVQTVRLRR